MPTASHSYQNGVETLNWTIANGASLSDELDTSGKTLCGFIIPAAWTAAGISFAVSNTAGGTYYPLFSSIGNESGLSTVAASTAYNVNPSDFAGWRFVKIRSGTSGTPVAQGASRSIILQVRAI